VVAGGFGGLGQRDVVRGVGHRFGKGESHNASCWSVTRILERVLV
jgi:hypothetical protein